MSVGRVPWRRSDKESRPAFRAFCVYRDIGPTRSLDRAFCIFAGHQEGTKEAPGNWGRWSVAFEWVDRAEAYDAHMQAIAQAAAEKREGEAAQRLADLRAKIKRDELINAQALIDKAGEMLKFPLQRQITRRDDPDGPQLITIEPARWTFRDAARMFDTGSKLNRLAAEMETDRSQVDLIVARELEAALEKLKRKLPADVFAMVLEGLADEDLLPL